MRCSLFWVVNASLIGIYLPTFRDSLSVPSSKVKQSKKIFLDCLTFEHGTDGLSRNVSKYQSALCNIPEDRRSEPRVLIEQGAWWSPNCFGRFGKETSLLSLPGIERRSLERQSHSPVSTPITVPRRVCCDGLHCVRPMKFRGTSYCHSPCAVVVLRCH